jgi:hypothetical protein
MGTFVGRTCRSDENFAIFLLKKNPKVATKSVMSQITGSNPFKSGKYQNNRLLVRNLKCPKYES